jgi:Ca2+-binding EF-hand superfamily protein
LVGGTLVPKTKNVEGSEFASSIDMNGTLEEVWALLTKAGNKRVQTKNLEAVLKKRGVEVTPEKLTTMLKMTPTDGTGSVDYKGFVAFFALLEPHGEFRSACMSLDVDHDGCISEAEVKSLLQKVEKKSAEQADALVAEASDGSGLISIDEFVNEVLK